MLIFRILLKFMASGTLEVPGFFLLVGLNTIDFVGALHKRSNKKEK